MWCLGLRAKQNGAAATPELGSCTTAPLPLCRSLNSTLGRTKCINTFRGFTCECGAGYMRVTDKVRPKLHLHQAFCYG